MAQTFPLLQPPPRRDEVLVIVGNAVYTKGQIDVSVSTEGEERRSQIFHISLIIRKNNSIQILPSDVTSFDDDRRFYKKIADGYGIMGILRITPGTVDLKY